MTNRAHLTPEITTDKNGKKTTVYRRSDQPSAATRLLSALPVWTASLHVDFAPSIAARIDMNSTVKKDRETLRRAMTTPMMNKHVAGEIRGRIEMLDRTTLTLAASAIRNKLITKEHLRLIAGMGNLEAREYIALATTVSDFETDAMYLRSLFYGACDVNEDGYSYARIDLSSEEVVSHHAALMRFAVAFQESQANSLQRFQSIFTERRIDSKPGQVLNEDLRDLVSRRPEDIERIIGLMEGSTVNHAAGLEHMLDHDNSALSEGAL
jgi:hypothetical protein